jgi:hypothetical protein
VNSPGGKRATNILLTNMRLVDNLSPRSKAFEVGEIQIRGRSREKETKEW